MFISIYVYVIEYKSTCRGRCRNMAHVIKMIVILIVSISKIALYDLSNYYRG